MIGVSHVFEIIQHGNWKSFTLDVCLQVRCCVVFDA